MNVIDPIRIPDIKPVQTFVDQDGARSARQVEISKVNPPEIEETTLHNKKANDNKGVDQAQPSAISSDDLRKQIEEANGLLKKATNIHLSFFVDENSGKKGVRVIDTETDEVIKQIPPEELLRLAARLKEQIGALLDETV